MKKLLPFIVIVLLALAIFLIKNFRNREDKSRDRGKKEITKNRDRGFDRRTDLLGYSKHARCRMNCRNISEQEVKEIMEEGKINYRKSDLKNARCPRYTVEGTTGDNQRVRVVFAQCNDSTVVVTVVDLETSFECNCPGDDNKYKNRY